jgi:hypothetical protein
MATLARHTRRQRLNRGLWVAALIAPAALGAVWWPPMVLVAAVLAVVAVLFVPAGQDAGVRYLDRVAGPLPRTALEAAGREDEYGLAAYVRARGEEVIRDTAPAPVAWASAGIAAAILVLGALLAANPGLPETVGRAVAPGLFGAGDRGLDPAGERVAPRFTTRGSDLGAQGTDGPQTGQPFTGRLTAPESDQIDMGTLGEESADRLVERLSTGQTLRPDPNNPGATGRIAELDSELQRELQRRAQDPEARRQLEEALERAYRDAPPGSEERRALDEARRRLQEQAEGADGDPDQAGDGQGGDGSGGPGSQGQRGQTPGEPGRDDDEDMLGEGLNGDGTDPDSDALGEGTGEGEPGDGATAGLDGSEPVSVSDPRAALGRGPELFLRGEGTDDGPTFGGVVRVAPGAGEIGSPLAGAPEEYQRVFESAITSDRLPADYRDLVRLYFR